MTIVFYTIFVICRYCVLYNFSNTIFLHFFINWILWLSCFIHIFVIFYTIFSVVCLLINQNGMLTMKDTGLLITYHNLITSDCRCYILKRKIWSTINMSIMKVKKYDSWLLSTYSTKWCYHVWTHCYHILLIVRVNRCVHMKLLPSQK